MPPNAPVYQLQRFSLADVDWPRLDAYPDRSVCQTRAWLEFVAATQGAEPVVAELRDGSHTVGWFTGLIVRKFGVKLLGSPFPGWSTHYMGFNLDEDILLRDALAALPQFAFAQLGCLGVEVMDGFAGVEDAPNARWKQTLLHNFEVDLTRSEDEIYHGMTDDRRYSIRRSQKKGVTVEQATDAGFVDDYYPQLVDVFAKQRLVPTYGRERVAALIEHLLPTGNLLLVRARAADGRCIGTAIVPGWGRMAYFWGGASWRPDQQLSPNEPVQWFAMRYWKARGAEVYDMGGAGEYKRKYGGARIEVPWFRLWRYPWLGGLRQTARRAVGLVQKLRGRGKK